MHNWESFGPVAHIRFLFVYATDTLLRAVEFFHPLTHFFILSLPLCFRFSYIQPHSYCRNKSFVVPLPLTLGMHVHFRSTKVLQGGSKNFIYWFYNIEMVTFNFGWSNIHYYIQEPLLFLNKIFLVNVIFILC